MAKQSEIEFTSYDIDVLVENEEWEKILPDSVNICRTACISALNIREMNMHASDSMVSILLSDDGKLRELNNKFRGQNKATNVLSFPTRKIKPEDLPDMYINEHVSLGDIALSLETIVKEAEEQNKNLGNHLSHLVIHATLHLLGYVHEKKAETEIMEALEIRALEKLGIGNPYSIGE